MTFAGCCWCQITAFEQLPAQLMQDEMVARREERNHLNFAIPLANKLLSKQQQLFKWHAFLKISTLI